MSPVVLWEFSTRPLNCFSKPNWQQTFLLFPCFKPVHPSPYVGVTFKHSESKAEHRETIPSRVNRPCCLSKVIPLIIFEN